MAQHILFTRPDGTIGHVIPGTRHAEATEEELAQVAARAIAKQGLPPGTAFEIVDESALPPRRFRNAWRRSGATVAVDLAQARQQRKAELLTRREAVLTRARAAYLAADEDGRSGPEIKARKDHAKALRELETTLDARLDAIGDLDELATFEPEEFAEE